MHGEMVQVGLLVPSCFNISGAKRKSDPNYEMSKSSKTRLVDPLDKVSLQSSILNLSLV